MKNSEIAMIVLIASISVLSAFAIANNIPQLKPDDKGVEVEKIEPISAEIDNKPSSEVFNNNAINPTVQTLIGGKQSNQGE